MKFDLEKFRRKELFVHCATRENANDFLKYLHNIGGYGWSNSRSHLIDENRWMTYQSSTCYGIVGGTELYITSYDDNELLKRNIIEWIKEKEPVKIESKFKYLITDNKNINTTMLLNESQKRLLNKLSDMKFLNVKSVTELVEEGFTEV